jgi:putative sterol carrier protein
MARFPSPEWLDEYAAAIQRNGALLEAAQAWQGDITLVVEAEPDNGVPAEVWAWFDVSGGEFRGARLVSPDEGERAKFVIKAPYSTWKDVIRGKVEPIRGMTVGKLKLSGDLYALRDNVTTVAELVAIAVEVSTEFADE